MMKRAISLILIILAANLTANTVQAANGPDFFPKGPYDSEILSVDILKAEAANFTALTLPDGTIRGYAPSISDLAFIVFESKDDGKTFSRVGKVDFGDTNSDNFIGQPRVILLNDGKYHLYANSGDGINCFSSTDGFKFTVDKTRCISKESIPTPPHYRSWTLSGPAIAILADGTYRMYFSDAGVQNDNKFPPHQIFSAISRDGTNWTVEPGARIGYTTKSVTGNAIHPGLIQHADGSVTLFYRSYIPQNIKYATSKDGLNFTDEYISWFGVKDPIVGFGNEGGDPSIVKDKNGNMVMFQGTWTGVNKLGISAIRLKVGKGTKFGEESGRNLGWQGFIQNREMNCVSDQKPSDPDYGRVWVLASSDTDVQCPDNYSIDKLNPARNTPGPKYAQTTKCSWTGSGPAPFNLNEIYFSGSNSCQEGYSVFTGGASSGGGPGGATGIAEVICYAGPNLVNAIPIIRLTDGSTKCPPEYSTTPSTPNNSGPGGSVSNKTITCFAKPGMTVKEPSITLMDASATCPYGYSTSKNTAKQLKITCVAAKGSKVSPKSVVLFGIGKSPSCPKGYKKK